MRLMNVLYNAALAHSLFVLDCDDSIATLLNGVQLRKTAEALQVRYVVKWVSLYTCVAHTHALVELGAIRSLVLFVINGKLSKHWFIMQRRYFGMLFFCLCMYLAMYTIQ